MPACSIGCQPLPPTLPVPSQSPIPAQPASAYVLLGLAGMSAGFLPDFAYSRHSSPDFKLRPRANMRAFSNDRYGRNRVATASVPSQSPMPPQPALAYTACGEFGISAGFFPDL